MKRIFTLSFLFTLIHVTNLYSQQKDYEWYLKGSGQLCGTAILLFKDGSYCTEHGCEASSFFSFGKWTQKHNILTFIPADPTTFKPISKVDTSTTNDSLLTVVVYDKKGNNITRQVTVIQHLKDNRRISMPLDSEEKKRTCIREANSTIVLGSLQKLLKQKIQINTNNASVIKIYLNMPEWNFHLNSRWNNDRNTFTLIKSKNKLTSTSPDDLDRNGNMKPSVFIKQEN